MGVLTVTKPASCGDMSSLPQRSSRTQSRTAAPDPLGSPGDSMSLGHCPQGRAPLGSGYLGPVAGEGPGCHRPQDQRGQEVQLLQPQQSGDEFTNSVPEAVLGPWEQDHTRTAVRASLISRDVWKAAG